MKNVLKKIDIPLFLVSIILIIIGLIMIFSASSVAAVLQYKVPEYYFFERQLIFVLIGLFASIVIMNIPLSKYKKHSRGIILIALAGLFFLRLYGTVTNSAKSWLSVMGLFTLQPSEFAKTAVIMYLAFAYGKKKIYKGEYDAFMPLAPCFIAVALVASEPDLGTALIISGIIVLIFYSVPFGKSRTITYSKIIIVMLFFLGLFALSNSKLFLNDMQAKRFNFLNPCDRYQEDTGYQVCNGYIAINNGGIFGKGLGKSTQKYLYLPEAHTDFIFPVIVEETGLIGGFFILFLYIFILFKLLSIARNTKDLSGSIIVFGTFAYLLLHMVVNLGGILALIPLTGVPLPFMSYGGSYMLNLIILLSLCQRVVIENKQRKYRSEFRKIMGG